MVKSEKLGIKVLPKHKWALEEMAALEGEPMAAVLRRLIRSEAERLGLWECSDPEPAVGKDGEAAQ